MGQLLVRNIPDDAMAAFKQRAKAEGLAAEALARRLLIQAAHRPNVAESVARMAELRAMTPKPINDLAGVLRETRDGDDAGH
jgi:plasmid stability protein